MSQKSEIKFLNIQIVNAALIAGVTIFLIVVYFFLKKAYFDYNDQSEFKFIAPIMLIISVFGSSFLFKKQTQSITKEITLQQKMIKYQTATIVRSALLEFAALIGIVATFTTSNYYFLIFTGIALVFMIFNFPTKDKFAQILNLDFDEKAKLTNL